MTTLARQKSQWQILASVVLVALLIHFAIFVLLGWYLLLTRDSGGGELEEPEPEKFELNVASLTQLREQIYPTKLIPVVPTPEEKEKAMPQERRMIDTDGIAAKENQPKDAAFESDRNTEAASELPPSITSKNKPLPNQKGELFERSPNLRDSKFAEDQKADSVPLIRKDAIDQALLKKKQSEPREMVKQPAKERPEEKQDSLADRPAKETTIDPLIPLPTEPLKPVPEEKEDQPLEEQQKKKAEKSDAEEKPDKPEKTEKLAERGEADRNQEAKKKEKPRRKLQSFSSERRRSSLSGSISRQGPSSVTASNTPMGRYWKKISKSVETEWQREATKHRDFNMPGSLRISFQVNSRGQVSNLRILSAAGVATIQKGYTIRSIRAANIPTMPTDLRTEMNGEPLEMTITFNY